MKYKIYYKSTGFITGILPENDLSNQTNYESEIDFDSVVDLESDLTDQVIFFSCKIEDGKIVEKESDERKNLRETKQARQDRKYEYPEIGEQLDNKIADKEYEKTVESSVPIIKEGLPW